MYFNDGESCIYNQNGTWVPATIVRKTKTSWVVKVPGVVRFKYIPFRDDWKRLDHPWRIIERSRGYY